MVDMSENKIKPNHIYSYIYLYKEDSPLNNLQWLFCHKTNPNSTNQITKTEASPSDLILYNIQELSWGFYSSAEI